MTPRPPRSLFDPDAELALLGLLIRDPTRFADPRISRLAFQDPTHRRTFDVLEANRTQLAGDPMTAADILGAANIPNPKSLASSAVLTSQDLVPDALIAHVAKLARRRSLRQLAKGLENVAEFPASPADDRETLDTIAAQTTALAGNGIGPTPWVHCDRVQRQPITWLWSRRIPFGKLTLLDGDPGLGKSALTIDLAARVSTGTRFPDEPEPDPYPATGVVILNAEDDLADTLCPRLDAAGADCTKIIAFDFDHLPTFPDGLEVLRAAITAVAAALVIIDPVMALLAASVDAYRDQDIRRVLRPLATLAAETSTAILLVRHLTKQSGPKALYRGGGSIGFAGAARSVLLLAEDPDDITARVLAPVKMNLCLPPPALRFTFDPTPDGTLRLSWGTHSVSTADQLLAPTPSPTESLTISDAICCLQDLLRNGDIDSESAHRARKRAGISTYAWDIARKKLGVLAVKNGHAGWSLRLPPP